MKRSSLLASLSAALIINLACASEPPLRHDPEASASFIVPVAWGVHWEHVNHRISRLAVRLHPPDAPAGATDSLHVDFVGGDWTTGEAATDVPSVVWRGERVTSEPSVLGAARVSVSLDIPPGSEVEEEVRLDRRALRLRNYPTVVALLEGVSFDTNIPQDASYPENYDPAHGYTSRGLGAWVEVVHLGSDEIVLAVGARFAHGTSDRPNMNAAVPHARGAAVLDLLLLGVAETPVLTGSVAYDVASPKPPPLRDEPCIEPSADMTEIALSGPAGAPLGVYGWTGFRFVLDPEEEPGAGYYIRSLALTLDPLADPNAAGLVRFHARADTCNSSKFIAFYAMRSRFEGAIVWLPAALSREPIAFTHEFETGSATVFLPGAAGGP